MQRAHLGFFHSTRPTRLSPQQTAQRFFVLVVTVVNIHQLSCGSGGGGGAWIWDGVRFVLEDMVHGGLQTTMVGCPQCP